MNQNCGNRVGVLVLEGLDYNKSGVLFIISLDFLGSHLAGAGDLAVEIVAVGGSKRWNALSCLSKGCRAGGMSVCNAAYVREGLVKFDVRGSVRRRVEVALDDLTVKVNDHHILRLHNVVLHARGLDDYKPLLAVDSRNVAPGEGDQTVLRQKHISLVNFFFQLFQHNNNVLSIFFMLISR